MGRGRLEGLERAQGPVFPRRLVAREGGGAGGRQGLSRRNVGVSKRRVSEAALSCPSAGSGLH